MVENLQTLGICVGAIALATIAISLMSIATNISRVFGDLAAIEDINREKAEMDDEGDAENRADSKIWEMPVVTRSKRSRRKQDETGNDEDKLH